LNPGVLSAAGLLRAPIEHEVAAAFPRPLEGLAWTDIRNSLDELDRRCAALMRSEGVEERQCRILYSADVCYIGQSYHLEVPLSPDAMAPLAELYREFQRLHDRIYGHSTDAAARLVNLRSIHRCAVTQWRPAIYAGGGGSGRKGRRRILVGDSGSFVEAEVYDRSGLAPTTEIVGPAIVEQADTTVLIEPGWNGSVAPDGSLLLHSN
jgi:N-methylhydantoinase A/oxoprolinase/acetone carboxylase beta subunit